MTHFGLPASCPDCGGELQLLNSRSRGTVSLAILLCQPCAWEFEVLMRIEKHGRSVEHQERVQAEKNRQKSAARTRHKEEAMAG